MCGRSFLILHGIENHRPSQHWQFWLAGRLRERGRDVLYPALPDPDRPSLAVWTAALRTLLARMGGEERVLICHSLACLLWFHSAALLRPDERADRLLLVSPPCSDRLPDNGASFRLESFDAAAVRASVTGQIRIVCSDSDPYNPLGAQALYAAPLGVPATVLRRAGHITPHDGYGPWPSLEAWCEDPQHPVTTNRTHENQGR